MPRTATATSAVTTDLHVTLTSPALVSTASVLNCWAVSAEKYWIGPI